MSNGFKMVFLLFKFKLGKINVITRFRDIVKRGPNKILYINATNDQEWTRQQVSVLIRLSLK
jgi:hypothetical protein